MTRTAGCPSCGAPLRFRGATSIVAVCQFCKATLVRDGVNRVYGFWRTNAEVYAELGIRY